MRGFMYSLLALGVGLLIGSVVGFTIVSMMKIQSDIQLYSRGFILLSLPYRAELLKIYLNGSAESLKNETERAFLARGGPEFCGFLQYEGQPVSVWKNESAGCSYESLSEEERENLARALWFALLEEASRNTLTRAASAMDVWGYLREDTLHVVHSTKGIHADVGMKFGRIELPEDLLERLEELLSEEPASSQCVNGERIDLFSDGTARVITVSEC